MIPTMILFGLVLGRWWRSSLVAGAVGWPLLLLVTGTMPFGPGLVGAAGLALANTAVGVLIHQSIRYLVRVARSPA